MTASSNADVPIWIDDKARIAHAKTGARVASGQVGRDALLYDGVPDLDIGKRFASERRGSQEKPRFHRAYLSFETMPFGPPIATTRIAAELFQRSDWCGA